VAVPGWNNRLDRDHKARGKTIAKTRFAVVGDAGRFVNGSADGVTAQIAHYAEAATPGFALNSAANLMHSMADA
jgi:hypothetical protein